MLRLTQLDSGLLLLLFFFLICRFSTDQPTAEVPSESLCSVSHSLLPGLTNASEETSISFFFAGVVFFFSSSRCRAILLNMYLCTVRMCSIYYFYSAEKRSEPRLTRETIGEKQPCADEAVKRNCWRNNIVTLQVTSTFTSSQMKCVCLSPQEGSLESMLWVCLRETKRHNLLPFLCLPPRSTTMAQEECLWC